jgi:hypothetical protein
MKWTRKAKPQTKNCMWCSAEFTAIRWDAWFCSPRCRKAWSRDPECAEFRRPAALAKLKRLAKQHKITVDDQWRAKRKTFEKRITQALLAKDSNQLAVALYELRRASTGMSRSLKYYPYRSFKSYYQGRWHLDPEKVERLTNSLMNPVLAQYLRSQQEKTDATAAHRFFLVPFRETVS